MTKRFFAFLTVAILIIPCLGYAKIEIARGEILRFFEERTGEWDSYILVKDSNGQDKKFFVSPDSTLIRRGPGIEPIQELSGGMKVAILYREEGGRGARAAVIKIGG